jgi:hypothetical protein
LPAEVSTEAGDSVFKFFDLIAKYSQYFCQSGKKVAIPPKNINP